jgi:superfamily II DNA helicase RecQ
VSAASAQNLFENKENAMKYKVFQYALPVDSEMDELNRFLGCHRITSIEKSIVCRESNPSLVFVIEYSEPRQVAESNDPKGNKIDYRKVLNPEQFECFSRLRDLRKSIADQEGVPVYTVLTNAQLADIVTRNVTELADLNAVPGIGLARIEKYGPQLITIMQDSAKGKENAS